jgi:hypothetical protein
MADNQARQMDDSREQATFGSRYHCRPGLLRECLNESYNHAKHSETVYGDQHCARASEVDRVGDTMQAF